MAWTDIELEGSKPRLTVVRTRNPLRLFSRSAEHTSARCLKPVPINVSAQPQMGPDCAGPRRPVEGCGPGPSPMKMTVTVAGRSGQLGRAVPANAECHGHLDDNSGSVRADNRVIADVAHGLSGGCALPLTLVDEGSIPPKTPQRFCRIYPAQGICAFIVREARA